MNNPHRRIISTRFVGAALAVLLCASPTTARASTLSGNTASDAGTPTTDTDSGNGYGTLTHIGIAPPCSGGSFTQPAGSPIGAGDGPFSVAVGDFNGDGKLDLAVANAFS